jgi:hypothetical protein
VTASLRGDGHALHESLGSAYIAFHRLLIPDLGIGGIEPGRSASLTLVKQVPTLVQDDLELTKPFSIHVGGFTSGLLLPDLVLLFGQFVDVVKHGFVFHNLPSSVVASTHLLESNILGDALCKTF